MQDTVDTVPPISNTHTGTHTQHAHTHACALPPAPQNAFKSYVRARDYCTTSRHIVAMCLAVVRVAVEMGNSLHIASYVAKAEAAPDATVRRLQLRGCHCVMLNVECS